MEDRMRPTRRRRTNYRRIVLLYTLSSLFVLVSVVLVYNNLVYSPEEKSIEQLLKAAQGKQVTGQDCKRLCQQGVSLVHVEALLDKTSSQKKERLGIYVECFRKQSQSMGKLAGLAGWEKEIEKTSSYYRMLEILDRLPELDAFDREFYPQACEIVVSLKKTLREKMQPGRDAVGRLSQQAALLCPINSSRNCAALTASFRDLLNVYKQYYDESFPRSLLGTDMQQCLKDCGLTSDKY
jgi:hypothetical protein